MPYQNDNKPWLLQKKFVVPQALLDLFAKFNVPESDQRGYCYILSKILILTQENPRMFAGIGITYFQDYLGNKYLKYLAQLEAWKMIEINHKYSHCEFNPDESFPKSYRLTPEAIQTPLV